MPEAGPRCPQTLRSKDGRHKAFHRIEGCLDGCSLPSQQHPECSKPLHAIQSSGEPTSAACGTAPQTQCCDDGSVLSVARRAANERGVKLHVRRVMMPCSQHGLCLVKCGLPCQPTADFHVSKRSSPAPKSLAYSEAAVPNGRDLDAVQTAAATRKEAPLSEGFGYTETSQDEERALCELQPPRREMPTP